jgi:sorting nexin-1/2
VTVIVDVPELMAGGVTKHHIYRIHGHDEKGEFEVRRRYSDFVILKNILSNRWPGFYIPALPEKKYFSNAESLFV